MPNALSIKLLTTVGDGGTAQTYTILDLLESYVFAGQDIRLYNPAKAYTKGTRVILPSNLSGSTTNHVYEAGVAIPANQAFALGNWKVASVATQLTDVTGVMSTLTTAQKTTLVGAINELVSTIATNFNASKTYTDTKITDLIGGSGEALDTLKELATALNNDPNFASTMTSELAKKSNIGHTHAPADVIQDINNQFVSKAQKDFWDAKASTALATQSTPGLMSPTDKLNHDNSQLWRLTNNTGSGKGLQGSDFNLTITSGMYNVIATDANGLAVAGTLIVSTRASSGIFQLFHGIDGVLATRNSNDTGATWSPWKRQADINTLSKVIMGNKLVDTSTITFVGKVTGSVVVNPHIFYRAAGVLAGPTVGVEQNATEIARIIAEDATSSVYNAANTAGTVSAHKFHFNIIEHIERTYGVIPASTLAEKVAWAKKNISELAFIWTGNGSSATGNKATVRFWNGTAWVQFNNNAITTAALPTRVSDKVLTPAQMDLAIDNTGFAYVVAYGEPSDGTTVSSISTDYIQLNVTLSTDMRTTLLMNNLQGYKITSDEGLAKTFGASDMNALTETGVYYTAANPSNAPTYGMFLVEVYRADGSSRFMQTATELATNTRYIRTFSGYYRQWDKVTGYKSLLSALSGNDVTDVINANFENKVTASTTTNPHYVKSIGGTSLAAPSNAQLQELDQTRLDQLSKLDGVLSYSGKGAVGQIAQDVYSFNLIELFERNYGAVPGAGVLDKVDWLRKNITALFFNWWGRGSGPSGNRVSVKWWNTVSAGGSWEGTPTSTSAVVSKLTNQLSKGSNAVHIDNQGMVHYTAFAEAASSTVPSTIYVDYVELSVEFTTNFINRLTSAPVRGKIDLANTSGTVNITLNGETGVIDAKVVNINGTPAETQTGAQTKATTAETNAKSYTDASVGAVVASAPNVLNTLQKLAAAINNDANYFTTIANQFLTHTQPASSIVESTTRRFATDVQIAFWNAKASTALVTQSAAGLMSALDKTIVDNGQQWKMTENSGAAFLLPENTDMNTITSPKVFRLYTSVNAPLGNERSFWYLVEVLQHDTAFFVQRATIFSPISANRVGETHVRTFHNGVWTPWRRAVTNAEVGKLVLGDSFKDVMTANYVSKVRASVVENPHIASAHATATTLLAPNQITTEIGDYTGLVSGNDNAIVSRTGTGQIAHLMFSFDIIAEIERKYFMTIPGGTTAAKAAWVRSNVNRLVTNWYGFGSGPTGNKASLTMYYAGASPQWGAFNLSTTSASVARLTITRDNSQLQSYIDDAGKVYVLAYADASNGSTMSSLTTNNIELLIELNMNLKTSLISQGMQATKVTDDSGKAFTMPNGTDFARLISSGFYKFETGKSQVGSPDDTQSWTVTISQFSDSLGVQIWKSMTGTQMSYRVASFDGTSKEFSNAVDTNKLASSIMGNKVENKELMTFMGKTWNNVTTNPHGAYTVAKSTLALITDGTEFSSASYDNISKEEGASASVSNTTNGNRAQIRFTFNILKHIESTIGEIPAADNAGKVAWLKANTTQIRVAWLGNGSSSAGNKASLSRYDVLNNVWVDTGASTTSSTPARLTIYPPAATSIDSTGTLYLLSYAEPSNGTVTSYINTKYIEVEVTVATDLVQTLVTKLIKGRMALGDPAGTEMIALDGTTGRADFKSGYINGQAVETQSGAQAKATTALNTAKAYTDTKVADLVASSPAALDTLKELADALGNDPNFATSIATQLGNKSDVGHKHPVTDILTSASAQFVTSAQVANWESKETPSGAQSKATTAETNAKAYADAKASAIVDGAPATLDTLRKLALAINSDPAIANTLKAYTDTKSAAAESNARQYVDLKSSVTIVDTRNAASPPSYYTSLATDTVKTTNGKKVHFEFKNRTTVGLTAGYGGYVFVQTIAKWNDDSGGVPVQIATDDQGNQFMRYAYMSTDSWSPWVTQETTAGAQEKATTAETNAKNYADVKVAAITGTPPTALNSLQKLAAAINNDPNVYTTLTTAINGKANSSHQHAPSEINTTTSARFVSDAQITSWTAKADASVVITAGAGLTGGGSLAASRTIAVSFAGNGSANTVARSDHSHTNVQSMKTQSIPLNRLTLADGIHTYTAYNDVNRPSGTTYGEVLSFGGYANGASANGQAEMFVSWLGTPKVFVRSLQDISNPWSAWNQVWTAGDFDHNNKVDKSTTITAGNGLTGGGNLSASRTLNVDFAGTGSANTVARSDHNHDSTYLKQTGGTLTGDVTSTANMTVKTHTAERVEVKSTTTAKKAYMKYNDAEDSLDFIFE